MIDGSGCGRVPVCESPSERLSDAPETVFRDLAGDADECHGRGSRHYDNCRFSIAMTTGVVILECMADSHENIPDAERDVLACLAQLEEATVRQLQEALAKTRPLQASSVLTLLNRLEARKLVTKRKADHGKAFVFRPTKASAKAWSGLMQRLVRQAFSGDTVAFMASFFETKKPTASEIEQLQKLLDELKAATRKGEK